MIIACLIVKPNGKNWNHLQMYWKQKLPHSTKTRVICGHFQVNKSTINFIRRCIEVGDTRSLWKCDLVLYIFLLLFSYYRRLAIWSHSIFYWLYVLMLSWYRDILRKTGNQWCNRDFPSGMSHNIAIVF